MTNADEIKGTAREAAGHVQGDDAKVAEGRREQAEGKAEETWDEVKDGASDLKDKLTGK